MVFFWKCQINLFVDSNFRDCQISGYLPSLIDFKGIPRYNPDFLMIDLDRNSKDNKGRHSFKDDRRLELELSKTLKHMKEKLGGYPTILFTIGGYHIYQPIEIPTALEKILEYDISLEQFLCFAKGYLSNKKADSENNPSFISFMSFEDSITL